MSDTSHPDVPHGTAANLTREQILAMPAGRDLDDLVAQHVMGWTRWPACQWWWTGKDTDLVIDWEPSSEIADAWKVVEWFGSKYRGVNAAKLSMTLKGWCCRIRIGFREDDVFAADAPSAQLAICRAALLAVLFGRDRQVSSAMPIGPTS